MAGKSAAAYLENSLAATVTASPGPVTSITLDRDAPFASDLSGYVLIDAFTGESEIRKVSTVTGTAQVNFSAALKYNHAVGDRVLFFHTGPVPTYWFGAKGDNSTDDEPALQHGWFECQRYGLILDGVSPSRTHRLGMPLLIPPDGRAQRLHTQPLNAYAPVDVGNATWMCMGGLTTTIASVSGNTITTAVAHNISSPTHIDTGIVFKGTLPTPLVAGRVYYIDSVPSTTTLTLRATRGGSTFSLTSTTAGGAVYTEVLSLGKQYLDDCFVHGNSSFGACTVSAASPGVVTKTAHGFSTGQPVAFNATTLPAGISPGVAYLVVSTGADTFTLTTLSGAAVNTTTTGTSVTVSKAINGIALSIQQQGYVRKLRADNCANAGLIVTGQQAPFENFQSNSCGTALALETAAFMWFTGFNAELCTRVVHNRLTAQVFAAGNSAISCLWAGVHVEVTNQKNAVLFDFEGAHGNIDFINVDLLLSASNSQTGWYVHTGSPGSTGYRIRGVNFRGIGSAGFTAINDTDRGFTRDGWTDFEGRLVDFLTSPESNVAGGGDGQKIVFARPDGGYLAFGGQRDTYHSFISRPGSGQTGDQAQYRDKSVAANKHFAINKDGRPLIKAVNTGSSEAPVTGDLAASEVIQWFDATNADPLVRFIAKNAAGTLFPDFTVRRKLFASKLWDPGSIALGAMATTTIPVTGAALGDIAESSHSTLTQSGLVLTAKVSAANTVTVTIYNAVGANPTAITAGGTLRVDVTKYL